MTRHANPARDLRFSRPHHWADERRAWLTRAIGAQLSVWGELLVAIGCAAAAVGIRFLLDYWLKAQQVYTIAFPATAVAALVGGWRAGALCAVVSQLSIGVLFVEPRGSFVFSDRDVAQAVTFYLMTAVLLCVTELAVRAQRALRLVIMRLNEADRAKTELLALIAHELRNPVSAIGLAAARLESDGRTDDRKKALSVIERQLSHVRRLVEDLTDASRIQNGKVSLQMGQHRVAELLGRAVELVEPALEQRHQVLSLDCSEAIEIRVDGARIVQMMANVLHNASKYSPDQTMIRVSVKQDERRVCIKVVDQGVGIPNEQIEWVFDTYAQLKPGADGLGLGLSLVRKLVELHGGTIKALSRGAGEGSTFEICLPAQEPNSR
jgi:signal transduction histidine kinase